MRIKYNQVFSLVLAFILILGLMPTNLFALGPNLAITDAGADPFTPLPPSLAEGEVWADKSVTYDGDGVFTVTLRAIGQDYRTTEQEIPEPVDVVLVLDTSNSMNSSNKLSNMKTAAKKAVEILLGVEGNRIAIVRYGTSGEVIQNFTRNINTLNSRINGLSASGGTNIQNGIFKAHEAHELIEGRSDKSNKPVIILMSDGEPTYYHNSLTTHDNNRQGSGSSTGANHVWWTIQQAMHAKNSISRLDIYTIGIGVGSSAYAVATLMPTEQNTSNYRPTGYYGETRTFTQTGIVQYYQYRERRYGSWSNWAPSTPEIVGQHYEPPVWNEPVYSKWISFSGMQQEPKDYTNTVLGNPASEITYSEQTNNYEEIVRLYNVSVTGAEYRNVAYGKVPFNHKYWTDSTITGTGYEDIYNTFVEIATRLTSRKPISYDAENKNYSDIIFTDVLGDGFEVEGELPQGVTQNGNLITWVIDGDDFETMPYDSTSVDQDKVTSVSFKVKISNSAGAGTYYTNSSASATFSIDADNPYYNEPEVTFNLTNRGWLTLSSTMVDAQVIITKIVKGPVSNTDRTFTFNLYYSDPDVGEPGSPINDTPISVTVNGAGTVSETVTITIPADQFDSNNQCRIYAKELDTATDPFWTYDTTSKKIVLQKSGSTATAINSAVFKNIYDPKGTLIVTKVWSGSEPNGEISFVLQKEISDGQWQQVGEGSHVLNSENNWTTSINGLDLDVKYRVQEDTTAPNLYDYDESYDPAHVIFTADTLTQTIKITNSYITPKGKITINKIWVDNDNAAGDRPQSVVFDYTGPNGITGTITLTASGNWTNYIEQEVFGTYTFTERVPLDYKADKESKQVTINIQPDMRNASLTFTNTYVEPRGSLTVTKEWVNEGGDTRFRPDSVTINVLKLNPETYQYEETGLSVTFPQADDTPWSHTFTDLDFGTYTVREVNLLPDYSTMYSSPVTLKKYDTGGGTSLRSLGISVRNILNNPTGKIEISKTWVEGNIDVSAVRPSKINVALLANGVEVANVVLPKEGGEWNHIFEDLPLDGTTVYTVSESAEGEDADKLARYESSIVYSGENGIVLSPSIRTGTAAITNTYAKGTITITKVWNDGENPINERPASAIVTLHKITQVPIHEERPTLDEEGNPVLDEEGNPVMGTMQVGTTTEETVVGTKTITRPDTTVVFYNLDIGPEYSYYVTETPIPFYATQISATPESPVVLTEASPNGQVTVTNTYTNPKGSLTVYKVWNHGNNPNPANLATVTLYKNGIQEGQPVTFSGSYTFTGLDLGATYTIKESPVPNYSTAISGDNPYTPVKGESTVTHGYITLTNTYIPETGSLTVIKNWVGQTGGPVKITLRRYLGDAKDKGFRLTAVLNDGSSTPDPSDDWKHTFTGLELYGPGGIAYTYAVKESGDLALYTVSNTETRQLSTTETKTITITNTYTPDKGKLTVKKVWKDLDGKVIAEPGVPSVEVKLVVDGVPEETTVTLNSENHWSHTWTGLDVRKTYRVIEVTELEEYDISYSNVNAQGEFVDITFNSQKLKAVITITNQKNEASPSIELSKTLEDDTKVLINGKATFNYTIVITNTGNRTLTDICFGDYMSHPEGATVTYNPPPFETYTDTTRGGVVRIYRPEATVLRPGKSIYFYYSVEVDKPGEYINTAHVSGIFLNEIPVYEDEPLMEDNTAYAYVKAPGLSITKKVIGPDLIRGSNGTFTYELRIRNDGDIYLEDAVVTDEMTGPAGSSVTYIYDEDAYGYPFDPDTKTWTIGDLPGTGGEGTPEDEIVIVYKVHVDSRGTYDNTATVTGYYYDSEFEPVELSASAVIIEDPEIPGRYIMTDSDSATVKVTAPPSPPPYNPPSDEPPKEEPPEDEPPVEEPPVDEEEVIPPEEVPEGEITIPDEEVPTGTLPKTGGVAPFYLTGLGALIISAGLGLRKKKNK